MIERQVTFQVSEQTESEFVSFIRERYSAALKRQRGFKGMTLLRGIESPRNYVLVLRFGSDETAALWRQSDEHRALSPILKSFHTGAQVVAFEVLLDGGSDDDKP